MSYRSTASFGKRQEYIAFGELLKRGFDVYATLVDDQQIDCVIRGGSEIPVYIDIQIKARSESAKQAATFAGMVVHKPRPNFFFMFYSEAVDCYWIFPSESLAKEASINKQGKHKGKYTLVLANQRKDGRWYPRPKWDKYKNSFYFLENHLKPTENIELE